MTNLKTMATATGSCTRAWQCSVDGNSIAAQRQDKLAMRGKVGGITSMETWQI